MENKGKKWDTFANYNKTIIYESYVGNSHGVHASRFPLNYKELKDIPDDIIFRVSRTYLDSAYIRISKMPEKLKENNETLIYVIDTIYEGILFKEKKNSCYSNLATAKSVLTYLKYVDIKSVIKEVIPGIVNYDRFLEHVSNKTFVSCTNDTELAIYNEIISLENINDTYLLDKINSLNDTPFKKNALLLLKAMVYTDKQDKVPENNNNLILIKK